MLQPLIPFTKLEAAQCQFNPRRSKAFYLICKDIMKGLLPRVLLQFDYARVIPPLP
jgi:hypothetical protein